MTGYTERKPTRIIGYLNKHKCAH